MSADIPVLDLTGAAASAVGALASELKATSVTGVPAEFLESARAMVTERGTGLVDGVETLVTWGVPAGIVRGLEARAPVPTPIESIADFEPVASAVATLGLLAAAVGQHRGFEGESGGRLVHSIAPIAANRELQISSSSSVELEIHTELAFAEQTPDFVLLLCTRQGTAPVATSVASLVDILPLLDAAIVEILFEPRFTTSVDLSVSGGRERRVGPFPVLELSDEGDVTIRCDFGEIAAVDARSTWALDLLREAVRRNRREVRLLEGDLFVADNRRTLHGRMPFTARFDGTDRWLLRAFVWERGRDLVPTAEPHVVAAFDRTDRSVDIVTRKTP